MTDDSGPSKPGKYMLRLEYEVDVTDPLALATANLAFSQQDDGGRGVDNLGALLMDRFFVTLVSGFAGQDLGFTMGSGSSALFTFEQYAKVNPAFRLAHPEITPEP